MKAWKKMNKPIFLPKKSLSQLKEKYGYNYPGIKNVLMKL